MGDKTGIQWTDATWNPVTGCTKVSQGCKHCYAERVFPRAYGKERKFIDVRTHPDRLDQPLRWKKPRRIFVNSMSDLFHEDVPDAFIAAVFGVMMAAKQHRFQVLTKRPERAHSFLVNVPDIMSLTCAALDQAGIGRGCGSAFDDGDHDWPLPNVWLGVSVEDQPTADERIQLLRQTPAAVRFVSYEPALGPVKFGDMLSGNIKTVGVDWLIVGGESGPKARPFDVQWARDTIAQCKASGVPCFVKQLGGFVCDRFGSEVLREWPSPVIATEEPPGSRSGSRVHLRDRAGGDPSEWPEDLRVREFPE